MPSTPTARAAYEAIEQARCEALGAQRMEGVAQNLGAALEHRYRRQGFDRIQEKNDVTLSEVLRLMARETMTGAQPPESAKHVVELWRPWIETKIGKDFEDLRANMADQDLYARGVRKLLADLDLEAGEDEASSQSDEGEDKESDSANADAARGAPPRGRPRRVAVRGAGAVAVQQQLLAAVVVRERMR